MSSCQQPKPSHTLSRRSQNVEHICNLSPHCLYTNTKSSLPLSDCAHIQHGDNRTTDFEWHLIWPDCVYVVYIYCFICVSFAIASWTVSTRETHENILKSCVCLRPDIVVNHQLNMSWSAHYDQNTTGYSGKLDINCTTYRCNRNENHMVWIIRQTNSHDHEYEQNVVGIHVLWAIQELFTNTERRGFLRNFNVYSKVLYILFKRHKL